MTKSYRYLLLALGAVILVTLGYYGARYYQNSSAPSTPPTAELPADELPFPPSSNPLPSLPPTTDSEGNSLTSLIGTFSCLPVESDDPENTKCLLAITTDTGDTYYLAGTKEVMLSMDQLTDNVRLKAAGFVKEISPEKRHFFVDSYEPVSAE